MSRFLNPYFQLCLTVAFVTGGESFLSRGASVTAPAMANWLGSASMGSRDVWIGVGCMCAGAITWVFVLRSMTLYLAFALSSVVHVTVPLCSWAFLGDHINAVRWAGISLVLAGIWIIARPASQVEERV